LELDSSAIIIILKKRIAWTFQAYPHLHYKVTKEERKPWAFGKTCIFLITSKI